MVLAPPNHANALQIRSEFQAMLGPRVEAPESVTGCAERGGSVEYGKQPTFPYDGAQSDRELVNVHSYGEETMIDDGLAEADVRDAIINVALREDQRPLCLYLDEHAEEMANPDVFGGQGRPANRYSYKQLCRVELRHFKRTVAQRASNIFSKFRKSQVLDMKQLTWVRLRKSKLRGRPLSQAGQLSDPQCRQSLLQANIGFRDFKQLRGTPNYDEQGKKESFAMLRQLGPFSIFYTFSMADMKWPEFLRCLARLVDGEELTLEEAANMSWKRRARLVHSEPVTSSRYHRHRMETLLTTMKL
jgi:hypothetical protein